MAAAARLRRCGLVILAALAAAFAPPRLLPDVLPKAQRGSLVLLQRRRAVPRRRRRPWSSTPPKQNTIRAASEMPIANYRGPESNALVLFEPPPSESARRPTAPPVTERDPWYVAFRVLPQATGHAAWAFAVSSVLQSGAGRGWLLSSFGGIGTLVHGLLGGVLGLLLAFRTNQSYNRYWRATEAFGLLQSSLVTVARKVAYLNDGEDQADNRLYRAIVRHLIALPVAVKHYLRGDDDEDDDEDSSASAFSGDAASYVSILNNQELAELVEARDAFGVPPPHALFASLYVLLRPIRASDDGRGGRLMIWSAALQSLDQAAEAYGVLKTIRNSRPPRSYALHVRRFLLAWLATLPLALLSAQHLAFNPLGAAFVAGAIAWALYSTDELAHLVGQPFDRLVINPLVRPYLLWLTLRDLRARVRAWAFSVWWWPPPWRRGHNNNNNNNGKRTNGRDASASSSYESSSVTTTSTSKSSSGQKARSPQADDDSDDDDDAWGDWPEWEVVDPQVSSSSSSQDATPSAAARRQRPPFAYYGSSAFPLDEWADYLVTSIRQHVLVHSVLDRRIRSRAWVVQPDACVQKPPPVQDDCDAPEDDDDDEPASRTTTAPPPRPRSATQDDDDARSAAPPQRQQRAAPIRRVVARNATAPASNATGTSSAPDGGGDDDDDPSAVDPDVL